MREGKFVWGASYVQNLEVHVGPEKLVRQFYLGRRWLQKKLSRLRYRSLLQNRSTDHDLANAADPQQGGH